MRRKSLEDSILGPVRRELFAPERIAKMAREMQSYHLERVRVMQSRAIGGAKAAAGDRRPH